MTTKQMLALAATLAIITMVILISRNTRTLSASSVETKEIYNEIQNDEKGVSN